MSRSTSIRTSLLRELVILVLVLGLAVLGATFMGTRRAVRGLSESLVSQTLTTVDLRLETLFAEVRHQLDIARDQAIAGGFDLDDATGDAEADFRRLRDHRNRLLAPIIMGTPQISSLMLAADDGREHMLLRSGHQWRNRWTSAGDGAPARWREWTTDAPPVERTEDLAYDTRTRPWYRGAIAEPGAMHWTEPYTFFTTGEPGITVSTTYDRADGRQGVIAFDVLLRDLSSFTRDIRLGERGGAAVLTLDRRLVGLPSLPELDDPAARAAAFLARPEDLGLALLDDAIAAVPAASAGRTSTYRFTSGGEAWWGARDQYELGNGHRLLIAILVPEVDLIGNLWALRLAILGLVAGVLTLGIARVVSVARRFSAPVEALVAQSRRITDGNLASAERIDSRVSEIRELVKAQEHMREGILARLRLEKIEADLDLARQIQVGLLPAAPPEAPPFEIAGWNRAADQTGGDFYDWTRLPDGRVVFTLADVTGHGIGPALIVSVYRAYVRATTAFGAEDLADALARINDLLHGDLPADRFITAVVGVLDPASTQLTMISAGHGPLLYFEAATRVVHQWDADHVPLGIISGLSYDAPRPITFEPGDMLVLVTDGFFEWAAPSGEQFGIDRLVKYVRDNQHRSARTFIEGLHEAVLAHAAGTVQGDDLTAVIIRRT